MHALIVADHALLPRQEFERLIELARHSDEVQLTSQEEDVPALGIALLAEKGGAFDWLAGEPDLYGLDDLKVRYP